MSSSSAGSGVHVDTGDRRREYPSRVCQVQRQDPLRWVAQIFLNQEQASEARQAEAWRPELSREPCASFATPPGVRQLNDRPPLLANLSSDSKPVALSFSQWHQMWQQHQQGSFTTYILYWHAVNWYFFNAVLQINRFSVLQRKLVNWGPRNHWVFRCLATIIARLAFTLATAAPRTVCRGQTRTRIPHPCPWVVRRSS